MPRSVLPHVHPTAVISDEAQLPDDVRIGPFAVVDGPVVVGSGCVIHAHARLIGPLTLGANNEVGAGDSRRPPAAPRVQGRTHRARNR